MKNKYLYNLLLTLTNVLFPILTFPYASHILGPEGIGKAQFALSLAMYFAMFAALGIPSFGVIEIARHRDDHEKRSKVFSELLLIHFACSLLLTVLYIAVILFVPFFADERPLYVMAGLIILLGFTSIDWFYFGIEEFRIVALRSALIKVLSVVFLFLFVKNADDYGYYLLTIIIASLGNNLLSLILIRKHAKLNFSDICLKRYMRPLFFVLGASLAGSIYTILDTVVLGFLADEKSVGLYTAAVKLTKIAIPFITSVGMVIISQVSYHYKKDDHAELKVLIDRSYNFTITFAFPILAGLILLAPELIIVFSGRSFLPATLSMQVLAVLPLLIGLGHLFGMQMLIPFGYTKEMFISTAAGVVCCLLFNIILVPYYNVLGAAVANVLCELTVTAMYVYFIKRHYALNLDWRPVVQAILASLIFIPIIFAVKAWLSNVTYILACSVCVCAASYFLLQIKLFKNLLLINTSAEILSKFGFKGKLSE